MTCEKTMNARKAGGEGYIGMRNQCQLTCAGSVAKTGVA
jgi:hypothetical protein